MPAQEIRTVKVWINAFIPHSLPGVTEPAPGASAGKTMVRAPLNRCFLSDQRDFSDYIHASSRLHSEITVDVNTGRSLLEWHNCDPTHEIDPVTGAVKRSAQAATNRMRFLRLAGRAPGAIGVEISAAAHNPLMPSPDVDFVGSVRIDVTRRSISFEGKLDQCPAYEMYASVNNTKALPMFRVMPLPGKTLWNLAGYANRPISAAITVPDRLP